MLRHQSVCWVGYMWQIGYDSRKNMLPCVKLLSVCAGGRGGPRHGADGTRDRQPDQDRAPGDKPLELEADPQHIDGLVCLLTSALPPNARHNEINAIFHFCYCYQCWRMIPRAPPAPPPAQPTAPAPPPPSARQHSPMSTSLDSGQSASWNPVVRCLFVRFYMCGWLEIN